MFKGVGLNDSGRKPESLRLVFAQWTVKDLEAAANFVLNWRVPLGREEIESLLKAIVSAWAAKDSKAAMAWAQDVQGFKRRSELVAIAIGASIAGGQAQPLTAFTLAAMGKSGVPAASVLTAWATAKPADALAFYAANATSLQGVDDALMTRLADTHPVNELWKMLNDLPAGAGRERLIRGFFKHATGIDAVKLALAEVEAGRLMIDPDSVTAFRVMRVDGARELLQTTDQPQWRKALLKKLWPDNDPFLSTKPSLALASMSDPLERQEILRNAGSMLCDFATDAASLKRELSLFATPEDRALALDQAVRHAADQGKPAKAIALLNEQTDDALRQRGLMTVGRKWDAKDQAATEAWMKKMPPSPERDWAVLGMIAQRAADNIDRARALLPMLSTAEGRNAAEMTIAAQWMQKSPASARSWLALQPLSAEQRADVENAAAVSLDGAFKPDGGWTGRP